ncbi:MAG: Hsp20/alpha crystallin family protein [Bacteroidetes bacterium]|nr:Hsp20/alpha crystallin family protein [Bacteroidota bacterium]
MTPFHDLFNGFFGRDIAQFQGSDDLYRSIPRVNIVEGADGFHLHLLAPGFTKEDLKLNVEDLTLTISAEKKQEGLEENARWTRREFGHSAFKRSFRLPDNVKVDAISAEHVNGVLHVTIPKAEESKPKSVTISIG